MGKCRVTGWGHHKSGLLDKTKRIFSQEIPLYRLHTDPTSSPTEFTIIASLAPAAKPCFFLPEPGKNGICGI